MMKTKLDRETVLKTLRGFEEVNRITDAERRERLEKYTLQQSLADFASLYATWVESGQKAGGNLEALAEWRLEHKLQTRKVFQKMARKQGLV